MPQLIVMGNGNKDTQQNTIVPSMFAEMFRFLLGRDVVLLQSGFFSDSSTNENYLKPRPTDRQLNFELTKTNGSNGGNASLSIAQGLAMIYGYMVYSETSHSWSVEPPSSGSKYYWIYIRLDLSNASVADCSLEIMDKGDSVNDYWTDAESDNLITFSSGKFVLPLYRVQVQASGAIGEVLELEQLNALRGKNIPVQSMVEIASLCKLAQESKNARTLLDNSASSTTVVEYTTSGISKDEFGNVMSINNKTVRMEY